jgi:hypothetical protein
MFFVLSPQDLFFNLPLQGRANLNIFATMATYNRIHNPPFPFRCLARI